MQNVYVWFGIRLRSDEVMSVIGERAARVLGCYFAPSQDPDYPDEVILEAEMFCLRFTISQGHIPDDPTVRLYQLNGENVIEPRWDYSDEVNLSPWMLQEFRRRDSPDWYIPTLDELKKEARIA